MGVAPPVGEGLAALMQARTQAQGVWAGPAWGAADLKSSGCAGGVAYLHLQGAVGGVQGLGLTHSCACAQAVSQSMPYGMLPGGAAGGHCPQLPARVESGC